mmetsp:Transcript_27043/g.37636  ORF Transcript_27043/g.37636 Transcript_27043/m.37636 type:complete len:94 (-) Transcript_27043:109-390(-)
MPMLAFNIYATFGYLSTSTYWRADFLDLRNSSTTPKAKPTSTNQLAEWLRRNINSKVWDKTVRARVRAALWDVEIVRVESIFQLDLRVWEGCR